MQLSRYSGDLSSVDFVELTLVDLSGGLRSIALPRAYMAGGRMESGIGIEPEAFGLPNPGEERLTAVPDLGAAYVEERDGARVLTVLCDLVDGSGRDFEPYPRSVARSALGQLRASGLADDAMMLPELEFYAFDAVRYATAPGRSYYYVESPEGIGEGREDGPRFAPGSGGLGTGPDDRLASLRAKSVLALEAAGIPVKYHHHESSPSQLEIELEFASLPRAADSIAIAKRIVRGCASELGLHATFMPKPIIGLAGSGLHVHQYLSRGGASLFPGDGSYGLSPLALSYSAGILRRARSGSLIAWSNPSTNSYRRLLAGMKAPTQAVLSPSRRAAMRVPAYLRPGEERVEFRVGDATANPHFLLAALLLAGLDGARRGLDAAAAGFLGEEGPGSELPTELPLVLSALEADSDYLSPSFPPELVSAWIESKRRDEAKVRAQTTPLEYELYF